MTDYTNPSFEPKPEVRLDSVEWGCLRAAVEAAKQCLEERMPDGHAAIAHAFTGIEEILDACTLDGWVNPLTHQTYTGTQVTVTAEGESFARKMPDGNWVECAVRLIQLSNGKEQVEFFHTDSFSWMEVPEVLLGSARKSLRPVSHKKQQ